LHKRRLSLDELQGLSLDAVRRLAEQPAPFDLPDAPPVCERAKADWQEAVEVVRRASEAKAQANSNGKGPALNRQTLAFIRDGAGEGDRHRLLYSAARNLGEFGCPPALAHALLSEAALDCGLAPKEVARQIECGLKDQAPVAVEQAPTLPPSPVVNVGDISKQLAALWTSPPTVEPIALDAGDAWEHPLDQLGAGDGPYGKEGGRR
jgi:hypothetical protein